MASAAAEIAGLLERRRRFGDELCGVAALLETADKAEWKQALAMIYEHEAHHVLEGLGLSQREIRDFFFDGEGVVNPYTGHYMVETCDHAVEVTEEGPPHLHYLMLGDRAAEVEANALMKNGQTGDGFWRVLPYGHELSDSDALAIGMWPTPLRSYLHLYRKVGDQHLEVTVATLDQSNMEAYHRLLASHGSPAPENAKSYELAQALVPVSGLMSDEERHGYAEQLLADFAHHHPDGYTQPQATAEAFIAGHMASIGRITEIHEALAKSLRSGQLTQKTWEALGDTLDLARELDLPEQWALVNLARSGSIDLAQHENALKMLINVRRYGVWQYLSQLVSGDALPHNPSLADFTGYARRAAHEAGVMPGCPGGFGLEQMFSSIWGDEGWYGAYKKVGPCDGCGKPETIVGDKNYCHTCIRNHCGV